MYTGLTRRIDNLGRITVPKEIRTLLNINDGDSMEIGIQGREITVRKFYPDGSIGSFIDDMQVFISVFAIKSNMPDEQCELIEDKLEQIKEIIYDSF